jgi:hypothetical protein
MSPPPTHEEARQSLQSHVADRGLAIQAKYGPRIGWRELSLILADRAFTRYPCELVFDAGPLQPGEFAHPVPRGEKPEEGFTLFVHPLFALQPDRVPCLALYQLVLVNYGPFVSAEDAEIFGAAALGLSRDQYYQQVCALADELAGATASEL